MSKSKLDNTETNMIAHVDGYILTQVELCKKLRPVEQEFALNRKKLYDIQFQKHKVQFYGQTAR